MDWDVVAFIASVRYMPLQSPKKTHIDYHRTHHSLVAW